MGPKKASRVADDSGCPVVTAGERERLPPRRGPESVGPLKVPKEIPKLGFPEWNDNLEMENWYSPMNLYEDPMGLPVLPPHIETSAITWKRPHQYLPPLPDPPKQVAKVAVSDPKTSGKKSAQSKKPDEKQTEENKVLRYCYVVYDPLLDPLLVRAGDSSGTTTPAGFRTEREWKGDFQRIWSAEQAHDINRWEAEEQRIMTDKELRERLLMEYEENWQIKYLKVLAIQKQAADNDLNDDDIMDDGDDGDASVFEASTSPTPMSITDLFGPMPVMDIEPNRAVKPTIPEGEYVDSPLASCCRVISSLAERLVANQPYYWEAIYPQTTVAGKKLPLSNPGGKYLVKLFVMGKWRRIEVDDRFPLNKDGKIAILSSTLPTEIWPTIIAKAIYKVFNWFGLFPSMTNPHTNTQSIGFILNTLTGWKSRPYISLLDPRAQEELSKVTPVLDSTMSVEIQPSQSVSNVILLCPIASVMTRDFNAVCGEAFVLTGIRSIHPSFSVYIYSSKLHALPDETLGFTSDTLEYHKITTMVLHTIPTRSLRLIQEWRSIISPTDVTTSTFEKYANTLPNFLTVAIPPDISMATIYITVQCAPCSNNIPLSTDRGIILVKEQQFSNAEKQDVQGTMSLIKPSITMPMDIHGPGLHVFRIYPHNLALGYSLEVESEIDMAILSMPDCLRGTCGMNVETQEFDYSVIPANSWTIIHRSTISLTQNESAKSRRLFIMFHPFDADATPYFHLCIIDNKTLETSRYPLLHANLEVLASQTYTIIIECFSKQAIPGGKYQLLVASDWNISSGPLTNSHIVLSTFEGLYYPNKYLTLFRDVYTPINRDEPKKGGSAAPIPVEASLRLTTTYPNAALKLEVIDAATGSVLTSVSDYHSVQLMHLPTHSDGYIIQGSFDASKWIVPESLLSLKPFIDPGKAGDSPRTDATTWSLEIFSSTLAGLTPDCTTQNKHAAIRYGWEQAERGRETRGVISRLLYLGKQEEAIEKMNEAEYTPEMQAQMLNRYDQNATKGSVAIIDKQGNEVTLSRDHFAQESEKRRLEMDAFKATVELATKERTESGAKRKEDIENMKKDILEMRQSWLTEREKLWAMREALRKEQPNQTPIANFP